MTTLDLTKNEKQQECFDVVLREVCRHNDTERKKAEGLLEWSYMDGRAIRYIYYGGAIRGGKTFCKLGILVLLCKLYPGSRWHVVRKSYPDLLRSTIPSMEKLIRGVRVRWNRSTSNYFVQFETGSRIYFVSENIKNDPLLNSFLGLETNGFLLEQEEELNPKTRERALERAGSWYEVEPCVPPPFIFSTFNPTYGWLKKFVYDVHRAKKLKAPSYFIEALPDHNPFVTSEQWASWANLDPKTYAQMIAGSWDVDIEGIFMHSFKDAVHVKTGLKLDHNMELWLSFDFNVDPMTCIAFQTDGVTFFRILKEWRIPDSDTYELSRSVQEWIDEEQQFTHRVNITGDASGQNANSGARGHINQYEIIHAEMAVSEDDFHVPTSNPYIADSRTFCNSVFAHFPIVEVADHCEYTIEDLRFVMAGADKDGKVKIEKTGMNKYTGKDNSEMGHLLDCVRYGMHSTLYGWIRIPKS